MKKIMIFISFIFLISSCVLATEIDYSHVQTYSENNKFGLQDKNGTKITDAQFNKLIKVGDMMWLVQTGYRYGLIDNKGEYYVYPKYRHAERYLGKFAKLGNENDYGLYSDDGKIIIPPMYSSIQLIYGKLFLTCKNYKYGVVDFDGNILLKNEFDDIYMTDFTTMRVQYEGEWYEFKKVTPDNINIDTTKVTIKNQEFTFKKLVTTTGSASGYYAVSTTDYIMKIISSLSPAYESTVDDLMLLHGIDTIGIVKKPIWILQFPIVYGMKYYKSIRTPNNGPLAPVKQNLRRKMIKG